MNLIKSKNIILFFLITTIFSSCGVTLDSKVNSSNNAKYKNPLIVMPFENIVTSVFIRKLRNKLQTNFDNDSKKVEFLLFETESDELY
jgi:hypothetical protein